jgi:soluble lytic murein transglycosylase-like protein
MLLSSHDVGRILKLTDTCYEMSGVDPEIILAIMANESSFDPTAVGPKGEVGLMGIYPKYWPMPSFNIDRNIKQGCGILIYYVVKNKGNILNALDQYNGGSGYGKKILQLSKEVGHENQRDRRSEIHSIR